MHQNMIHVGCELLSFQFENMHNIRSQLLSNVCFIIAESTEIYTQFSIETAQARRRDSE